MLLKLNVKVLKYLNKGFTLESALTSVVSICPVV